MSVPGIFLYTPIITNTCTYFLLKNWFYVNCWGEIKISLQFITLFGFHTVVNFSLSAGGLCAYSGSRLAGSHLVLFSSCFLFIDYCITFFCFIFLIYTYIIIISFYVFL